MDGQCRHLEDRQWTKTKREQVIRKDSSCRQKAYRILFIRLATPLDGLEGIRPTTLGESSQQQ